jgi:hypothetical protein
MVVDELEAMIIVTLMATSILSSAVAIALTIVVIAGGYYRKGKPERVPLMPDFWTCGHTGASVCGECHDLLRKENDRLRLDPPVCLSVPTPKGGRSV